MYAVTIDEKRGHAFKAEEEEIHGRVWRDKTKGENVK